MSNETKLWHILQTELGRSPILGFNDYANDFGSIPHICCGRQSATFTSLKRFQCYTEHILRIVSYHLHILHYHFALCTFQTHTQAQVHYLALPILTSTRTLYIYFFALSTPAAQDHFPPGHRHCQNHCTLQQGFLYLETLCVKMFSLCVCIYVLPMCMYM